MHIAGRFEAGALWKCQNVLRFSLISREASNWLIKLVQISGTSSLIFLSCIRFRLKQQILSTSATCLKTWRGRTQLQRLTGGLASCCHRCDYAPPGGQWTLGLAWQLPGTLLRYSSGPPTGSNMRPSVPPSPRPTQQSGARPDKDQKQAHTLFWWN